MIPIPPVFWVPAAIAPTTTPAPFPAAQFPWPALPFPPAFGTIIDTRRPLPPMIVLSTLFAAPPAVPELSWQYRLPGPPSLPWSDRRELPITPIVSSQFGTELHGPDRWYRPLDRHMDTPALDPRRIPVVQFVVAASTFFEAPSAAAGPEVPRPERQLEDPRRLPPVIWWPPEGADTLRFWFTTGAGGSYGSAQSNPHNSLGGYRSATEAERTGVLVRGPLPNVEIALAARQNAPGAGAMDVVDVDRLRWTAPGSTTPGPPTLLPKPIGGVVRNVTLADGEDPAKYVRVNRTAADDLAGAATVELTEQFNNVFGLADVPEALSAAGGDRYRAIMLENVGLASIRDLRVYLAAVGPSAITSGGGLPGSGSGTITGPADAFAAWEDSGVARIDQSNGTLREIVYWTRVRGGNDNTLTVPANGRALFGTSPSAGATTDRITPVPPTRLGVELASPQYKGAVQTIADETIAPNPANFVTGAWSTAITSQQALYITELHSFGNVAIWLDRNTPIGMAATARLLNKILLTWSYESVAYSETLGGLFRVADTDRRRLELRAGVNADPALDANPVATQLVPTGQSPRAYLLANPWTPNYVLTTNATTHLVLDFRDEYNQRSDAIQTHKIKLDAGGAQVTRPPSDPEHVKLTPAAGGKIRVEAVYFYERDADGQQADQFALYYRTDGTNPDPSSDVPTLVSLLRIDGAALLLGSNGEPYWLSPAFSAGTPFKLIIRTRRSSDGVTSTNSTVHSATTATSAAGTATGRVFYRQIAEQK